MSRLGLEAALPILEAEEALKGEVSDARIFDTVLTATGSEIAAGAALEYRIAARLRAGERPEV